MIVMSLMNCRYAIPCGTAGGVAADLTLGPRSQTVNERPVSGSAEGPLSVANWVFRNESL